jgi:hypothetical protein
MLSRRELTYIAILATYRAEDLHLLLIRTHLSKPPRCPIGIWQHKAIKFHMPGSVDSRHAWHTTNRSTEFTVDPFFCARAGATGEDSSRSLARGRAREFLVAVGRELVQLLGGDLPRLEGVLRRIEWGRYLGCLHANLCAVLRRAFPIPADSKSAKEGNFQSGPGKRSVFVTFL